MNQSSSATLFTREGRLRQECFTGAALRALRAALDAASRTGWSSIRTPHLFIGLLEEADDSIVQWLAHNQLQGAELRQAFLELFDMSQQLTSPRLSLQRNCFSEHLLEILEQAYQRARQRGASAITSADLLASVLTCEPSVVIECLRREGYEVVPLIHSAQALGS